MSLLNKKKLRDFINLAGEKLKGDWVILGGTVLPLLGQEYRVTIDIDMASIDEETQKGTLALMEIAESLSLPVETINQAGAYFLKKQKFWKKNLVLLHEGKNAKIYRPNLNLYIELKIQRMSESDLQDCLEFLKIAPKVNETVDRSRLQKSIETLKPKSEAQQKRLEILKRVLAKN